MRFVPQKCLPLLPILLLVAATGLTGCDSDNDPVAPGPSATFQVTNVTPADEADSVSVFVPIKVKFSRPLNPASINVASFRVVGTDGTARTDSTIATFTPVTTWTPGRKYTIEISSSVSDTSGHTLARDFTSTFTVIPSTGAPIANAGPDQIVTPGDPVILDAHGSRDPNQLPLAYHWKQLGGPDVLFSLENLFIAPDVPGAIPFQLIVDSAAGRSHPDTVTIFVGTGRNSTFFVSHRGSDTAVGTRQDPFATIQRALDVARDTPTSDDIFIAGGYYHESPFLAAEVGVYGGFDPGTWVRDLDLTATRIIGQSRVVHGHNLNLVNLDGLQVLTAAADTVTGSTMAIQIVDSSDITLTRLKLTARDGGDGPEQSLPLSPPRTPGGAPGQDTSDFLTPQGGAGGSRIDLHDGGDGAVGSLINGFQGIGGDGPNGGLGGGGGVMGYPGSTGAQGGTGAVGENATEGGAAFGTLDTQGDYQPANGRSGSVGLKGSGGGGGGSGGGAVIVFGASGGGGGTGGEGGYGGFPGLGGGGSFGIVMVNVSGVSITGCQIATGSGGQGGPGGTGGSGGPGGSGGAGGEQTFNALGAGAGGKGGNGGTGGTGGFGSGGGGGPSIGILHRATSNVTVTDMTFQIGQGGPGGTNPSGGNGASGESLEVKVTQ